MPTNHSIYVTTRKTASQQLRDAFVKEFDPKGKFFDFAFYLLTTNFRDENSGAITLPKEVVTHFAYDAATRRSAEKFLIQFRRECMSEFEWTDSDHYAGLARQGCPVFSRDLISALEEDRTALARGDARVFVKSGKPLTLAKRTELYKTEFEDFSSVVYLMPSPEAKMVAEYMNGRPIKLFNRMLDRLQPAAQLAMGIENEHARKQNLETLAKIYEQPKPFYAPSYKMATDRIFGVGSSLLSLKSDVRKVMTGGMWECDLKSAQISIISRLWGLLDLEEFLLSGRSIWTHLGPGEQKPLLKDCIYALVFGMTEQNLKLMAPEGFMEKPLVRMLLKARSRRVNEVLEMGFVKTVTGREISVTRTNVYSALAQEAQAVELSVLLPVIELADAGRFDVVAWQHDGFTLAFPNQGAESVWLPRVKRAVNEKANELGLVTELLCEYNP